MPKAPVPSEIRASLIHLGEYLEAHLNPDPDQAILGWSLIVCPLGETDPAIFHAGTIALISLAQLCRALSDEIYEEAGIGADLQHVQGRA